MQQDCIILSDHLYCSSSCDEVWADKREDTWKRMYSGPPYQVVAEGKSYCPSELEWEVLQTKMVMEEKKALLEKAKVAIARLG